MECILIYIFKRICDSLVAKCSFFCELVATFGFQMLSAEQMDKLLHVKPWMCQMNYGKVTESC